MSYHFSKIISGQWDEVKALVTAKLQEEGFGIITEIDMKNTFKNKLDIDFKPYTILGACIPSFAHQAVSTERHIGTMLPCNVVLQEDEEGKIEVTAVDPVASMMAVKNEDLAKIAGEVTDKLKKVIESL